MSEIAIADYLLEYNREREGVIIGDYVIQHKGLYKRINGKWGERDEAKVYATLGRAQMVVGRLGWGNIEELTK